MRTLQAIENELQILLSDKRLDNYQRTAYLVRLMNELERNYHTMDCKSFS